MRFFLPSSVLAALFIAQGAWAATDPQISAGAPSVPPSVTVSNSTNQQTPSTYVGYVFTLNNGGGSDLNSIRLTGTIRSSANLTAITVPQNIVLGLLPSDCTLVTSSTETKALTLTCDFGTKVIPPNTALTFPVIVKVPQYVTGYVPAATADDFVKFEYTALFREGKSTTGSPTSDGVLTSMTKTPVAALSESSVKSLVISTGGDFFTGKNGATNSTSDVFATSVRVPILATGTFTTATILEEPFAVGCTNFKTCYASQLTIRGTFDPYLMIVLRQDAGNIKPGTKIESVLIEYVPDATSPLPTTYVSPFYPGLCASPTTPREDGLPCFAKPPVYYKNSKVPGWTPALDGDFEWTLINKKNGGYKVY